MIYLDYNATTPLDPEVRAAMLPFLGELFGNPSSPHATGRAARAALDDCRDRVARVLGCKPSELVFTSGGTESNNLALHGAVLARRNRGRHLITSAVEHQAVLQPLQWLAQEYGCELTILPVDTEGRVDPDAVANALRNDTILVSIQAANNEIGTLQPVATIGQLCRQRGVLFHTDAAQWCGKEPLQNVDVFSADLASMCAHKFYGPKGAGLLYVRSPLQLPPLLRGGSHELDRRAGTENLAAIAGLTAALERFVPSPVFAREQLAPLALQLRAALAPLPGVTLRSPAGGSLANTVAFTVAGTDSIALLAALDLEGICAASGSACSSGALEPSHVIQALGVASAEAGSLVRLSLGRENTATEIATVAALLPGLIARCRSTRV